MGSLKQPRLFCDDMQSIYLFTYLLCLNFKGTRELSSDQARRLEVDKGELLSSLVGSVSVA